MPRRMHSWFQTHFKRHGNAEDRKGSKDQKQSRPAPLLGLPTFTQQHIFAITSTSSSPLPASLPLPAAPATGSINIETSTPRPPATPATGSADTETSAGVDNTTVRLPAAPATNPTNTETSASADDTITSLPVQLWDRAYNELKKEETELVDAYEKILSRQLQTGSNSMGLESQPNIIAQNNSDRRRQMKENPFSAYAVAELNENEPFHWNVERVVKELCTPERTWDVTASHKLPDPEWLASKLRELEADGETLLIYADQFGWLMFWEILGIKNPAHSLSIQEAIKQFRETSTLYYRQKRDIDLPKYPPRTTPAIKPDLLNPSKPTPLIVDRSIQEPTTAAIGGPVSKPSPAEVDSAVTEASPTIASSTAAEASPAVFKDAAWVSRKRKRDTLEKDTLDEAVVVPRRSERLKRRLGNSRRKKV